MSNDVVIALISVLPQLFLILVGSVLAVRYRGPIGQFLSSRVGSVSAFGLRFDLKPTEIQSAVDLRALAPGFSSSGAPAVPTAQQISDRAGRMVPHVAGRTILWVDDHPDGNRIERRLIIRMGVFVEVALSNGQAEEVLRDPQSRVDLVLSDIKRDSGESGKALVGILSGLPEPPRLIFYVWKLDPALGTPQGAFAITNRPDVLLDYVMDALDRLPPIGDA